MKALYTAAATATGGRDGHVKSENGLIDMDVRIPKELGGQGGDYANPEMLFASGYSLCYDGALNLAARLRKISVGATTVRAEVGIGKNEEGGFVLSVKLYVDVPGVSKTVAEELTREAHHICPYSNAIRGNVEVETHIINK